MQSLFSSFDSILLRLTELSIFALRTRESMEQMTIRAKFISQPHCFTVSYALHTETVNERYLQHLTVFKMY